MSEEEIIKQISQIADEKPQDLLSRSLAIASSLPELKEQLEEAQRMLQIAKLRDLMDDEQILLAYRLTLRKLVKEFTAK